ncbi:unnamed protein product, partial [Nesidiocoris tenuis]
LVPTGSISSIPSVRALSALFLSDKQFIFFIEQSRLNEVHLQRGNRDEDLNFIVGHALVELEGTRDVQNWRWSKLVGRKTKNFIGFHWTKLEKYLHEDMYVHFE